MDYGKKLFAEEKMRNLRYRPFAVHSFSIFWYEKILKNISVLTMEWSKKMKFVAQTYFWIGNNFFKN